MDVPQLPLHHEPQHMDARPNRLSLDVVDGFLCLGIARYEASETTSNSALVGNDVP